MKHSEGFLKLVNAAKARVREIDVAEYWRMLSAEPHLLIDVREDNEFAAGHAKGALHIGKGIIERDIETAVPDHGSPIVLYCGGGYRSALAADALQKMGYRNVASMNGGWRGWTDAALPTTRD